MATGGFQSSIHRDEYHTWPFVVAPEVGAEVVEGRARGPGCAASAPLPTPFRLMIFWGYRFQEYVSWDLNPDCTRVWSCSVWVVSDVSYCAALSAAVCAEHELMHTYTDVRSMGPGAAD